MFKFNSKKSSNIQKPLFTSQPFISSTLVNGNFTKLVSCPKQIDTCEWLALHTFEFFNYTNLFYGAISEYCTIKDCPVMNAGIGFDYFWIDSNKRTVKVSAPQYVDYVMTWIQNLLCDEAIFPTKADGEFNKDFILCVKQIFRQLFRVISHIYHHHYEKILHCNAEGHLNTLTAHFFAFVKEFELLEKKEMMPLQELFDEFESADRI